MPCISFEPDSPEAEVSGSNWRVRHINQPLRGNSSGFFIFCDSKNRILWHFPCTGNCCFWPLLCVSFFSILCLNRHVLNFSVVIIPGIGENRSAGIKLPDIPVWESLSIKTTIYFTRAAFGDWCYLSFVDDDPTNNRIAAFHWKRTFANKKWTKPLENFESSSLFRNVSNSFVFISQGPEISLPRYLVQCKLKSIQKKRYVKGMMPDY